MANPRRIRLDLATPPEVALRTALAAVEAMPADKRLTEASNHVSAAIELVGRYVDEQVGGTRLGDEGLSPGGWKDAAEEYGARLRGERFVPPPETMPAWRKRPPLTRLQYQWMLMRAVCGNGDVSKKAMAEIQGEVEPDHAQLNPPEPIRECADYR